MKPSQRIWEPRSRSRQGSGDQAEDTSSLNEAKQAILRLGLLICLKESWFTWGPDPIEDKRSEKVGQRQFLTTMEEKRPFRCDDLFLETITSKARWKWVDPIKISNKLTYLKNISLHAKYLIKIQNFVILTKDFASIKMCEFLQL